MTIHRLALLAALATASTAGICTKTYNYAAPSPVPTTPVADTVEFRVLGNPGTGVPVAIRITNSIDGASVLTTVSLPFIASVKSLDAAIFLDVEATAVPLVVAGSSLQAQIYVNGRLFREAIATGITPLTVSASGTFRR